VLRHPDGGADFRGRHPVGPAGLRRLARRGEELPPRPGARPDRLGRDRQEGRAVNAQTHALLQDVIRREGRSLLQYVSESFPWTTPEERAALAARDTLVREERDAAAALARFLVKRRLTPPYLGAYPMSFTTINYVSLDHLLPLLVEHQRRGITAVEQDVAQLDDREARAQVQSVLDMNRRH